MTAGKTVSLLIIIFALAAIYLQSGGQLTKAYDALKSPGSGAVQENIATLGIAILVYVLFISLLPDDFVVPITGVLVLGALIVNHQHNGSDDLIGKVNKLLHPGAVTGAVAGVETGNQIGTTIGGTS